MSVYELLWRVGGGCLMLAYEDLWRVGEGSRQELFL